MNKVFTSKKIGNIEIKNRMVLPPMVTFTFSDGNGFVSEKNIDHYAQIAKNGIGLIIVEATAIDPNGRLSTDQLGIWDDKYIEGLSKIADTIHENGAKAFIQIHHAGLKTTKGATDDIVSSSDYEDKRSRARELLEAEIKEIIRLFVKAAERAKAAGFDGVEVHGAHGYLLTQFFSEKVNKRSDKYGGSFKNRNRIAEEIYKCIRYKVGDEFIIGIRMGCNENSLEESIKRAESFETLGYDYLNISTGFDNSPIEEEVPEGFPGNFIVYGASRIKENVNIPVMGVNMIKEPSDISSLLNEDLLDFVAIGRGQLADYNFTRHLKDDEPILTCLECKPCKWFSNGDNCPRQIQVKRENA